MFNLSLPRLQNLSVFVLSVSSMISFFSCRESSKFSGSGSRSGATAQPPEIEQTQPVPSPVPSPVPQQSITQGSFTVWANPPNPQEGQRYDVHIRVKLPSNAMQYNRADLSGTLFGTDGYFQSINGFFGFIQPFFYTPGTDYAELIMPIPGAKRGVNDSLKVTSRLLNESQTISIWFGAPTMN